MDDFSNDILTQVGDALAASGGEEKRQPVSCVIEHALLPEHLADYADSAGNLSSAQKADEKDLSTLREKHHAAARLLAEGVPDGIVAELVGYAPSYLSVLKNNPSMVDLINFYRGPKNEAAKAIGERLRMVAGMSLERIQQALEEEGSQISISELTAVAKLGFDRSGHGPQSTVNNVTEHRLVGDEELLQLAREARQRERGRIVDVEAVREVLPAPEEKHDESTDSPLGDSSADSSL